jgi:hypothetical protein
MKTNEEVESDLSRYGVEDLNLTFEHVALQDNPHSDGFTCHSISQSLEDTISMSEAESKRWREDFGRKASATLRFEFARQDTKPNHVLSSGIVRNPCFPNDVSAYCFTLKFVKKEKE